jgi:hypothetical protein
MYAYFHFFSQNKESKLKKIILYNNWEAKRLNVQNPVHTRTSYLLTLLQRPYSLHGTIDPNGHFVFWFLGQILYAFLIFPCLNEYRSTHNREWV